MPKPIKPYSRSPQVIRALYEYGPLNRTVLSEIIYPRMNNRQTNRCLQRLLNNGLILRCNQLSTPNVEYFYQLAYNMKARAKISKILDVNSNILDIPNFRGHHQEHSVLCAYWMSYLQKAFSDATVLREFHINSIPSAQNRLLTSNDLEFYPDIVALFPNTDGSDFVTVAIEVEKSLKSRKRIFQKLNKYSTRSFVDGVIYICPSHSLSDVINNIYIKRLKHTARRTRKYGDNFLMFSDCTSPVRNMDIDLLSSSKESISLAQWVDSLRSTPWSDRTDSSFQQRPNPGTRLKMQSAKAGLKNLA